MSRHAAILPILLAVVAVHSSPAAARDCVVDGVAAGRAELIRGQSRIALPAATPISQGDRISKDSFARLRIACSDGAEITVAPGSAIDLGAIVAADPGEPLVFRLLRGIAAFVLPEGSDLTVTTPTAIAAVRGTDWLILVEEGRTEVFVRSGEVAVTGRGGPRSVTLGPGEGVAVSPDGLLLEPLMWGEAKIDRTGARLGFDWR